MINHLFQKFKSPLTLHLVLYHVVILIIVFANLPGSTWLLGWDAVNPELDFPINFSRAFTATWQENYGVGTVTGHGFAATLPHTIATYILSFFMPLNQIRPVFIFLCFYLGGLGMFFLMRHVLMIILRKTPIHVHNTYIESTALLSSFYYLFNLGTTQQFTIPLEAFTIHFAAFPWLFYSTLVLLEHVSYTRIIGFLVIHFFASGQGFIPSVFIAYASSLCIALILFVLSQKSRIHSIRSSILVLILVLCANAYWILPVGYFTATNKGKLQQSYNNILSTPEFIQKSEKYGTIEHVALIKGFYWQAYELGDYVMSPFRTHHAKPFIPIIGYTAFVIACVGAVVSIFFFTHWIARALAIIFVYFFGSLAISTPPFSILFDALQTFSPTFYQAFRTTFTKFGVGAGFSYSCMLGLGAVFILQLFSRYAHKYKQISSLFLYSALLGLILYALPLFTGHFFFQKLHVTMPQSYFDIMSFFRDQPDGRIADFPQDCAEGWYGYTWGYFGSGFYWYGIKQPIMARSFDIWNPSNENYFWEITTALRQKNYAQIDKIFDKYDITWVMYDPNLIHCRGGKGFLTNSDFLDTLVQNNSYQLHKTFTAKGLQPILLFQRKNTSHSPYIQQVENPINSAPLEKWNDTDTLLSKSTVYISDSITSADIYYPFWSLFNRRDLTNNSISISSTNDSIRIQTTLPSSANEQVLTIPPLFTHIKNIPVTVRVVPKNTRTATLQLIYDLPQVILNNTPVITQPTIQSSEFPIRSDQVMKLLVNDVEIQPDVNNEFHTSFSLQKNAISVFYSGASVLNWVEIPDVTLRSMSETPLSIPIPINKTNTLSIYIKKSLENPMLGQTHSIDNEDHHPVPCNNSGDDKNDNKYEIGQMGGNTFTRLISQDSSQCLTSTFDSLSTNNAYILESYSRHVQGLPLKISVTNKGRPAGIDTFMRASNKFESQFILIPPTFSDEIAYDVTYQNDSFNEYSTINDIGRTSLWYVPYGFMRGISIESSFNNFGSRGRSRMTPLSVDHPNPAYYKVVVSDGLWGTGEKNKTLVLSQSFDEGWMAWAKPSCRLWVISCEFQEQLFEMFPFVFGEELENHVLVNNWANGFTLRPAEGGTTGDTGNTTIVLFFWPQVLEWVGFLLLPLPFLWILRRNK